MGKDSFRWVAQPAGDSLTRKLNEEIRKAEDNGYELKDKDLLQKPEDGETHEAIVLLHFTKSKYDSNEHGSFVSTVDISTGDEEDNEEGHVNGYIDKTTALDEELAGKLNEIKDTYPNHEIVDIELDEEGRTLYLMFEPF